MGLGTHAYDPTQLLGVIIPRYQNAMIACLEQKRVGTAKPKIICS